MQMVKSSKARKINKKILLEGERLIGDALKCGLTAEALFFSKQELIDSLPTQISSATKVYQVNHNKIQLWSELTTSPGILGQFCGCYSIFLYSKFLFNGFRYIQSRTD